MAQVLLSGNPRDLITFTDCNLFEQGRCSRLNQCPYRHCHDANRQSSVCNNWPSKCRSLNCPYKHPQLQSKGPMRATSTIRLHTPPKGLISFFWDIENVPIPKNQNPFEIVQRIRQKFVIEAGLREDTFNCYSDVSTISHDKQLSLSHANVRMIHVPDRKPNASDRHILLDLDRFERIHPSPATVVLISGDIDFVRKLSDLRHREGHHVIVIHNRPAKLELKKIVNAHYSWDSFTQSMPTVEPVTQRPLETTAIPRTHGSRARHRARGSRSRNRFRSSVSQTNSTYPQEQNVFTTTPKEVFVCPKCPSQFETMFALRQHQTTKIHTFPCPNCKEAFFTESNLTAHQTAQNHQIKEYQCEQCNRRFPKIESLEQHQVALRHKPLVDTTATQNPDLIIQEGIAAMKQFFLKETEKTESCS